MMKYVFYLLILSVIFSIGLYIGMDRTSPVTNSVVQQPITDDQSAGDNQIVNELMVDRQDIIKEMDNPNDLVTTLPEERPFLSRVANGGEQVVKIVCDNLVTITHTFVDGIF
ncbi:hypothetical protein [Gracilibacillus xinjiangensis]|uniref:DUF3679 domain-containing protein n=1 Tax=Gracilibacillus xinjiangensis TaxID=1193282 RepID=A0ABV8WY05_9BACI